MAYTLLTLKKLIMDTIGEDSESPTYWDSTNDVELEDLINDAVEEMLVLSGNYIEEIHVPLYTDRRHYNLDAGKGGELLYIKGARVLPEGYTLSMVDPISLSREDYRWITRTGTPRSFYIVGNDTIRPVPYPSAEGQSLELIASIIPPNYSEDDEVVDIEDSFITGVTAYCSYMLFASMRNLEAAGRWFKEYQKAIATFVDNPKLIGRAIRLTENAGQ